MELFDWTHTVGGLLFMAFSFSCFADPYLGKFVNRQGPRLLSMIGFGISTAGFVALSTVTHDMPTTKALLGVLFVLFGFCCAFIQTPNVVEISVVVDAYVAQNSPVRSRRRHGPGYALFNVANAAGSLVDPARSGALRLSVGWSNMCYSFVALNALSVALIVLFSGGWMGNCAPTGNRRPPADEGAAVQSAVDASRHV
jgi:hypothetical protein